MVGRQRRNVFLGCTCIILFCLFLGGAADMMAVARADATATRFDLKLPWTAGEMWAYSGGPHPYDGSDKPPFTAVDFAPSPIYDVPETSGECLNTYTTPTPAPTTTPTSTATPPMSTSLTPSATASPTTTSATPNVTTSPTAASTTVGSSASPAHTTTTSVISTVVPMPTVTSTSMSTLTAKLQIGADSPMVSNSNVMPVRSTRPLLAPHAGVVIASLGAPHYAVTIAYNDGTGRQILLQHVAPTGRIAVGSVVQAGDSVGYPSNCGWATGTHVHLVAMINEVPQYISGITISGWTIIAADRAYDGWLQKNGVVVGVGSYIVSDNTLIVNNPDDVSDVRLRYLFQTP